MFGAPFMDSTSCHTGVVVPQYALLSAPVHFATFRPASTSAAFYEVITGFMHCWTNDTISPPSCFIIDLFINSDAILNRDALWSIQGKKHYLQAAIVGGIHHT